MNLFNITNAIKRQKEKNWPYLYWAVDIHETLCKGHYNDSVPIDLYPGVANVLKWINIRKDQKLILFTSSYLKNHKKFCNLLFKNHGVKVDYVNKNPECPKTSYATFHEKFYFNILLDDKAGGNFEHDWFLIGRLLEIITGDKIFEWTDNEIKLLRKAIQIRKNELDNVIINSSNLV